MSKYIGTPVVSLSVDTVDVSGDITATDSTPELILLNDTHEDTDGGREGKITFKGEQSGGEVTVLAQIQSGHDGTSDDEKGDLIFKTNDGSDGASPTEAMRIDSSQNVGIGTSSPDTPLHIEDGDVTIGNSTTTGDNKLIFKNTSATLAEIRAADTATGSGALLFTNNGSERMRIDSSGNVGIGTSSPTVSNGKGLVIADATAARLKLCDTTTGEGASDGVQLGHSGGIGFLFNHENEAFQFGTNNAERMRIDSAGRLLIGTTTEGHNQADNLTVSDSGNMGMTLRSTDSGECSIFFSDGTSGTPEYAGYVQYIHSDNSLRLATNATERMRLDANYNFLFGLTTANSFPTGNNFLQVNGVSGVSMTLGGHSGTHTVLQFRHNGATTVGSIVVDGSSTTYNTSSDYRLKENLTNISDGITRVKQLKPKRFNFIVDADKTVDGFLAHEASTVVPEAVTGEKDGLEVWKEKEKDELPDGVSVGDNKLDADGNTIPEYQGIDQSKLVPLLTAALQEAIAKIETLETKVAALEGE